MPKIIIIIPVYKKLLTEDEILSLKQCFKVLSKYEIRLVCPDNLDVSEYNKIIGKTIKTERFAPYFFEGIKGYNELTTNCEFYNRFHDFDFMLIYQLDAWVFYDKLTEWCEKNYDYIGAPWFEAHKTHEEGFGLWCCGNGGLSLRKISKMITVTNPQTPLYSYKFILKHCFQSRKMLFEGLTFLFFKKSKNNLRWYREKHAHQWEDTYLSYGLDGTPHQLYKPSAKEAALFSFECSPAYLHSLIGNKLPFGCHGWRKYQYDEFWSKFIPQKQ